MAIMKVSFIPETDPLISCIYDLAESQLFGLNGLPKACFAEPGSKMVKIFIPEHVQSTHKGFDMAVGAQSLCWGDNWFIIAGRRSRRCIDCWWRIPVVAEAH